MKTAAALASLVALAAGPALAFDCTNVTLPSTAVICSDPELSALGDERQQLLLSARVKMDRERAHELLENQRQWIVSYSTSCGVAPDRTAPLPPSPAIVACFKRAALQRNAYLRSLGGTYAPAPSNGVPVAAALPPEAPSPRHSDPAPATAVHVAPPPANAADAVALREEHGIYSVPVRINGAITLHFVIDTGAGDVQLPADVVMTLIRAETLNEGDLLDTQTYRLANGSTVPAHRIRLREMRVGNHVLHNVTASVGSPEGDLLLGQSFLSRFKSWTMDNDQHALFLVER